MAIRLGNNKWQPGDYMYSDDLNDTFGVTDKLISIFTPTTLLIDYDNAGNGVDTAEETFSITDTSLLDTVNYLQITFLVYSRINTNYWIENSISIDTAEYNSGNFTSSLGTTTVDYLSANGEDVITGGTVTLTHIHELTSGEKANGIDIKITLTSNHGSATSGQWSTFEVKKIYITGLR